jgi:hypothetical protein
MNETNDNIKSINLSDIIQLNNHSIKIVDIQDLSSLFVDQSNGTVPFNSGSKPTIYEIEDEDDDSSESEDDEHETQPQTQPETQLKEIKEIKLEPEVTQTQAPLKHEQMRVDDLRKLVIDKGLSTKEESKKLKKPELLFLLQKNV